MIFNNPQNTVRSARRNFRGGFTLIEILVVVTIIGIAGAIVVPQMLTAGTLGIQAAARMVIADILYAQNEAIANQSTHKIIFDVPNNSYRLTDAAESTLSVNWKGAGSGNYTVDFNNESGRFGRLTLQNVNFGGESEIAFDALGTPSNGGTIELKFQDTVYRITITSFTGRVTVEKL